MSTYTAVLDGSKTNVEGHSKFLNRLFGPGVALGLSTTSLQVVQRQAGANMSVDVLAGDAHLQLPSKLYSFWSWTDAVSNVPISTADPTNPRIDAIVAWVDISATTTADNNSPGSLKFQAISGNPAGTPSAPTDTDIQNILGASVAWIRLANVTVNAVASNITNSGIADMRTNIVSIHGIPASSVDTASIKDQAVTEAKLYAPIWWTEIGRTTLSAAADAISVTDFPPKKYLRVISLTISNATTNAKVRFNGDGGNNYAFRVSTNNSADVSAVSTDGIQIADAGSATENRMMTLDIVNVSALEKLVHGQLVSAAAGAANIPSRRIGVGKWANTSTQINRVDLVQGSTGDFAAGSEIIVLGHD